MNIKKADISKNITKESLIPPKDSAELLSSFISLIKKKSKTHTIKLSGFGVFSLKKTPKRIGRNPKTLVSYIIPEQFKLRFKASNNIKEKIN
jgi:integration host factor subunit alpha